MSGVIVARNKGHSWSYIVLSNGQVKNVNEQSTMNDGTLKSVNGAHIPVPDQEAAH